MLSQDVLHLIVSIGLFPFHFYLFTFVKRSSLKRAFGLFPFHFYLFTFVRRSSLNSVNWIVPFSLLSFHLIHGSPNASTIILTCAGVYVRDLGLAPIAARRSRRLG